VTVAGLTERICIGGWPGFHQLGVTQGLTAIRGYLDEIRRTDVNRFDSSRRDLERVGRFLRSLARNVATATAITKLAADAVVETRDGRWAAFEIKLGGRAAIEEGVANLLKFSERVDTTKIGSPACLGVIVATGYGYVRPDGAVVIPISALRN
jgi:hypothetical protein